MARDGRLRVSFYPWRAGLATAGQQSTIPEESLWQARNVGSELDGLLSKRPGTRQWGQTLKKPDSDGTTTFFETFLNLSRWTETDASSGKITSNVDDGELKTSCASGTSNETHTQSYFGTSVSDDWAVRFSFRQVGLQAYTASDTNADTVHFKVIGASGSGKLFAIWSGGLYYQQASDSTFALVDGSSGLVDGGWHGVEIRMDKSGNTTVYLDDTLIDTIVSTDILSVTLVTNSIVDIIHEVDPDEPYNTFFGNFMYSSMIKEVAPGSYEPLTTIFEAEEIRHASTYEYVTRAGSSIAALMVATKERIYHDIGYQGHFRSLMNTLFTEVYMAPFRRDFILLHHDGATRSKLYTWDGRGSPKLQSTAPDGIQFVTEHKQRLWAAGDRNNPLRIYYSGDRQPNIWFNPGKTNVGDQFDSVLDAGYLEIPGKGGDQVTALWGDYYGVLLVFTKKAIYRVSGDGINSFAITAVNQDVGVEGPRAVTQVGNDIWFLSLEGVRSLQTTQQFGDIKVNQPSAKIDDLWSDSPSAVRKVERTFLYKGAVRYVAHLGLVFVAVPELGSGSPDALYVYNLGNQEWLGPWELDCRAIDLVELRTPKLETIIYGGEDGQVGYIDEQYKGDIGSTAYTMRLETALMNGRSIDRRLPGHMKTWKTLRLFLLPRGDWDFNVTWHTDDGRKAALAINDPQSVDKDQNMFDTHVLTTDFRLTIDPDARLHSREEMGIVEIPLDTRGRSIRFIIEQENAGQDLAIQGIEVDFLADGYEQE